jgi:hypothetical protein
MGLSANNSAKNGNAYSSLGFVNQFGFEVCMVTALAPEANNLPIENQV